MKVSWRNGLILSQHSVTLSKLLMRSGKQLTLVFWFSKHQLALSMMDKLSKQSVSTPNNWSIITTRTNSIWSTSSIWPKTTFSTHPSKWGKSTWSTTTFLSLEKGSQKRPSVRSSANWSKSSTKRLARTNISAFTVSEARTVQASSSAITYCGASLTCKSVTRWPTSEKREVLAWRKKIWLTCFTNISRDCNIASSQCKLLSLII